MPTLCRDCDIAPPDGARLCPACGSRRLLAHPDLFALHIAHIDCDAFYASVEKRDHPEWRDRPLIVGGGTRGVVSTACYIARLSGVRSAMPMYKARAACPDAVVVSPDFPRYLAVAQQLRGLMGRLTPLVQPLSIDEAVLDLAGTEQLHGAPPAVVLARFARQVEREIGITVSIGLAANRLRAKLAAERDKPRGFAVLGSDAPALLAPASVGLLPGIGPAQLRILAAAGITRIGDLQSLPPPIARARLGADGPDLVRRALLIDPRPVQPGGPARSISAETTFATDLADRAALEAQLWHLCEKLARRLRGADLAAGGVVLKLKTNHFAQRTRARRLSAPTLLPDLLFAAASALLAREADGTKFRLIGIGAQPLVAADLADQGDLADPTTPRLAAAQAAIERVRTRFGTNAIGRGRGFH